MPADPLYTVAFPNIPAAQMQWMQDYRLGHDPHHLVVDPHFTMVFGVRDLDPPVYLEHIAEVAKRTPPIQFACRYAMLGADDVNDTAYVFLVPDQGNAAISLLHDQLYRGPLQALHRLEFPYIPHIGIAATQSFQQAKAWCDELNREGVLVEGWLNTLTTGVLKDGRFQPMRSFALVG